MTRDKQEFLPAAGLDVPRFAGIATFMRLPHMSLDEAKNVDIGLIGVPWDGGTTNRPGPRHAPRQMRDMSSMIRHLHPIHRFSPFERARCTDLGDVPVNPADLDSTLKSVEAYYRRIVEQKITPLSIGGDHLISLPILKALGRNEPVGLIQFDAHTDLWDGHFGGSKYTHGTPFRRAIEAGVLDPKRTIQIGIRGSIYDWSDRDFGKQSGVRIMEIEEAMALGPEKIMAEAHRIAGDSPVYVSFDIDCLDPAYAPGTGTPEAGGFTTFQAQQMLRGLMGLNVIGADVVEVSPPFDPSGVTALAGVTMLFELLCVLAESRKRVATN